MTLEKLFTSKNRVKILRFLLFEKGETHLREISRQLKIPASAVKREIDNLVYLGIIEKIGNKIELNERCNFLSDLKSIFIKTDAVVYPIKRALEKKNIEFALIFGSFARGDYGEESDIDLLIVGDINLSGAYNLLKSVEDKVKREINPVVWSRKDLISKKNTGFVRDIFAKKIIMIRGDENELSGL